MNGAFLIGKMLWTALSIVLEILEIKIDVY